MNINEWYHVAAVYDGASLKIYINGILDQQGSYSGSLTTYSGIGEHFYLGAGNNSNLMREFFDGSMDNTSLWLKALTQQEIQEYMDCPPTGNETGLVGYWNFEEGSGSTVLDQTSNGNNGAINGATYDTNVPSQLCQLRAM